MKLVITQSLFDKIQSELILYEKSELRRLWDFIRSSNSISIIDINADPKKYEEISKYFDKWVIDLIELISLMENSIVISDDYNFIRLLKIEYQVKGTITLIFLKYLLENSDIDSKTYSLAIGVLADRVYIILPFDGEDLFQIVIDDDCKILLRSYHLVNHITFAEVQPSVYMGQFVHFIELLWRSGSLYDDKIKWLSFITNRAILAMNQRLNLKQMAEVEMIKHDLRNIWQFVISNSKLSELAILESEIATLFENESSRSLREYFLSKLLERRSQLSESETPSS